MSYVLKSTKFDKGTGREYTFYFQRETMGGAANQMADLEQAKKFDTISEARRTKRIRFGGDRRVEIVKVVSAEDVKVGNQYRLQHMKHAVNNGLHVTVVRPEGALWLVQDKAGFQYVVPYYNLAV